MTAEEELRTALVDTLNEYINENGGEISTALALTAISNLMLATFEKIEAPDRRAGYLQNVIERLSDEVAGMSNTQRKGMH